MSSKPESHVEHVGLGRRVGGWETKKAGTQNSVRGAKVVADDEDIKTTRE
jgi:hypothetical protein